jgi:uncharacterized membrane protein|tara:strand:- start:1343 stop:1741 length:399 start_codon:yes stop_codon:yes gene_type:complete
VTEQAVNEPSTVLPVTVKRWQQLVLASYYGLIVYFGINSAFAVGFGNASLLIIWFIQVFPLLLFAIGLHRQRVRTYTWLCLVVLLYFMHGVLVLFDPLRVWLGVMEVNLCVALFGCLVMLIRRHRAFNRGDL